VTPAKASVSRMLDFEMPIREQPPPVERPVNPERRGDAAWPAGALDAADKDSSGIADFTSYDVEHPV
jgi:hypothetical protein